MDILQIRHKGFLVLAGDVFHRATDLMNHTELHFGFRESCGRPGQPSTGRQTGTQGGQTQLLRNADNLKYSQAVQLQELLAASQPLATVYMLKDALTPRASGKAGSDMCGTTR